MIKSIDLRPDRGPFQALIQNLAELVTIHDPDGTIRYATPSAVQLLGYPASELIGMSAFDLIHPDDLSLVQSAFAEVVQATNPRIPTEFRVRRSDGHWLDVETVGSNFVDDPIVQGIVLTSRNITERKRHERELLAITTTASALRTASTRAEMLPIILDQVIHLLPVDGAALALRESSSGETVIELGRGNLEGMTGLHMQLGEGVSGYVIKTGQPYRTENILTDPLFAGFSLISRPAEEPAAIACLPLKTSHQTIGALWVTRKCDRAGQPVPITDAETQLLTAISDMSANAIYRATLYEQTEHRLHCLEVLQTINLAISESIDLQATLNILLGEVMSRLHIDAANVLVMDSDPKSLKCAASRGFTAEGVAHSVAWLNDGLAKRALIGQKIIHIPDLTQAELPSKTQRIIENEGFMAFWGVPLMATGRTVGVLELFQRTSLSNDLEWTHFLDGLAAQAAFAIEKVSLIQDLQRGNAALRKAYDGVIQGWSHALELRDHETQEHTHRVTETTMRLAHIAGIPPEQWIHVWRGSMLHDIGKIGLPDTILLKPGPLSEEERKIVQRHPTYAYELISPIENLRAALDIPYCHHERWDGSGYPRGLEKHEIPLSAQIFSIVDVYDALTSARPYRKAWPPSKALDYIREQSGRQFNPELAQMFLENYSSLIASSSIDPAKSYNRRPG